MDPDDEDVDDELELVLDEEPSPPSTACGARSGLHPSNRAIDTERIDMMSVLDKRMMMPLKTTVVSSGASYT
jgi:hypothetical protein